MIKLPRDVGATQQYLFAHGVIGITQDGQFTVPTDAQGNPLGVAVLVSAGKGGAGVQSSTLDLKSDNGSRPPLIVKEGGAVNIDYGDHTLTVDVGSRGQVGFSIDAPGGGGGRTPLTPVLPGQINTTSFQRR
jgi:hypothetical protein